MTDTFPIALGHVLVVDDEVQLMHVLVEALTAQGYSATGFQSGEAALAALQTATYDLLLTDLMMPGMNGIDLLKAGMALDPHLMGIIMTGQGTVPTAVEAMKTGAFDYVLKPFRLESILPVLARAREVRRLRLENISLRETVAMYNLTQTIAFSLDSKRVLESTADAALQQTEAEEVSIMLLNPKSRELYVAVVRGKGREHLLGQRISLEEGIAGWVARQSEPLILNGEVVDPRFAPVRPRAEIHSSISLPMLAAGKLMGVLNVNSLQPRHSFTPGQVKALSILTSTAATALQNEALYQAVQAREKHFRALVENISDVIVLVDEQGRIIYTTPSGQKVLGYTQAELHDRQAFELIHPDDLSVTMDIFAQVLSQPGATAECELRIVRKDGEIRWVQVLGTNLLAEPSVGAIVSIYRDITEPKQAEDQIQRQLKRLNALRLIDSAISSSFDLHKVLDVVLQQAVSWLGADAAAVLLFDPQLQTMEYAASRGFRSNALRHTRLKLGEDYAGRAVLERKSVHIPNFMESGGRITSTLLLEHESFVDYYGTPLIVKDEVKGVLEIYHRSHLQRNPEWLEFMEALAGQAAIAIDNSQLFDSLQRSNAELEKRVTERTQDLYKTNMELERANRTKDEFLATMSHELRTPLNSILGMSESLLEQRRDPLSEYQARSLQVVQSSGHHLLELINDILDLSKIEAGKFDYHPQPLSVDEVCRSSLAFVKTQAAKKSITITYINQAAIPQIYADPRRIKQILINLLTNAVKFTLENGQVILQIDTNLDQDSIRFSVIDTGIGIAPEDLQRLFQPFVQVDSSLNRQYQGTGLGLALVQRLTDLHGGSVDVESEVGKGSRFSINLACQREEIAKLETSHSQATFSTGEQAEWSQVLTEGSGSRPVILLAEDNMPNILTIGEYLESYGYEIVVAHDGLEAIEKAEAINPNIILMDIQMPGLNGLDAIARLRNNPRFASTPIIALTALAMPGDRERCLKTGASEYMSKPVSLKGLAKTIRHFLQHENEE